MMYSIKKFGLEILTIIYIVMMLQIKCDAQEKKNRLIIIYLGITKFIFLFGSAYENKLWLDTKYEVPDEPLMIFAYLFVALLIDIDLVVFMKNKKTKKIAIYGVAVYLLVFLIGSFSIDGYSYVNIIYSICRCKTYICRMCWNNYYKHSRCSV